MQPFRSDRAESRLESLCAKGCRRVWQDIASLERGEELQETRDLTAAERKWLLAELKQIMSVYDGRCAVE